MLQTKDAAVNIAVKDLGVATKFYQDKLGLEKLATGADDAVTFKSGNTRFFVYRSEFAGTNKATTLTWRVGEELDEIVRSLASKGIKFEHYDMPGITREGEIHSFGSMKSVWFKDPDGNILCVMNG